MRTERRGEESRAEGIPAVARAGAIALLLLMCAPPGRAQRQFVPTDGSVQISSIEFAFTTTRSFQADELRRVIAETERGSFAGLRNTFDFIPLVTPVGDHPFDPVELQKDVVRLVRFYQRAGFLLPGISYDFTYDPEDQLIDLTFIIDEGPPLLVRRATAAGADGGPLGELPADLAPQWESRAQEILPPPGERFTTYDLTTLEERSRIWFMNRGYPFAEARALAHVDSASHLADIELRITPGVRSRIGQISVTGVRSVGEEIVLRELPFTTGDLYALGDMGDARREILTVGMFRRASVEIPPGTPPGETVPVAVDVTEAPLHMLTGAAGYDSRGGLSAQVDWILRNFTGGARTLTPSVIAQTGVWATEAIPEILYRFSLSLTQPYVLHRRLSLIVGPFLEYRDDYRDQSEAIGGTAVLAYQIDFLQSITLQYFVSDRRIKQFRYGEYTSGSIDILTLLGITAKGERVLKSSVGSQISIGSLDDITVPRKGWTVRPTAEVTVIPSLNSIEYWRLDVPASLFLPLSESFGLAFRGNIGTIFPFGSGLPSETVDPTQKVLQFRDVLFTAGGPEDVRAWGSRLLGPKFPDVRVTVAEGDTTSSVEGYIPVGAFSRTTFSMEARLPFPGLGKSAGIALYLDGGKVWTDKPEFTSDLGWFDEEQIFFGTGVGLLFRLPVGTIRGDVGYKLNPSYQDLRDPAAVFNARVNGDPPESVPPDDGRRFQFHLSISVSF
jgi:outer membrane protein insertion porin family